jgi:hypothetical protein
LPRQHATAVLRHTATARFQRSIRDEGAG